eukprot:g34381.t1
MTSVLNMIRWAPVRKDDNRAQAGNIESSDSWQVSHSGPVRSGPEPGSEFAVTQAALSDGPGPVDEKTCLVRPRRGGSMRFII